MSPGPGVPALTAYRCPWARSSGSTGAVATVVPEKPAGSSDWSNGVVSRRLQAPALVAGSVEPPQPPDPLEEPRVSAKPATAATTSTAAAPAAIRHGVRVRPDPTVVAVWGDT